MDFFLPSIQKNPKQFRRNKMPEEIYKKQLKELRDIQKDGKKIALIGNKMINRRIKLLQGKLRRSRYKRKKQTFKK